MVPQAGLWDPFQHPKPSRDSLEFSFLPHFSTAGGGILPLGPSVWINSARLGQPLGWRSGLGRPGLICSLTKAVLCGPDEPLLLRFPSGSAAPSQGRGFPQLPPSEKGKQISLGLGGSPAELSVSERKNHQQKQLLLSSGPKNGVFFGA